MVNELTSQRDLLQKEKEVHSPSLCPSLFHPPTHGSSLFHAHTVPSLQEVAAELTLMDEGMKLAEAEGAKAAEEGAKFKSRY